MVKKIIFILLFLILVYTRFVGLDWGLPYPMHPDERNMAVAVQELHCEIRNSKFEIRNCMNPRFFAYGQFPLYLGRLIATGLKFFNGNLQTPVSFQEAIISLRIISAVASILNAFVVFKIIKLLIGWIMSNVKTQISKPNVKSKNLERYRDLGFEIVIFLFLTFSPYFIQFSHFGTTESLLMLFYSSIIYLSLKIINNKLLTINHSLITAFISGLAIATKISSLVFLAVPFIAIILNIKNQKSKLHIKIKKFFIFICHFAFCILIFAILFSPHNLINFRDFMGSMRYESDVALGRYVAFYTRQFVNTIPVLFQITKIFPYTLGWPQFILAILGFIFLPWRHQVSSQQVAQVKGIPTARSRGLSDPKRALTGMKLATESVAYLDTRFLNFLRFAFLIYFLPNAFIFAKWTRFMAPILPILSIFAVLFIINILSKINSWIMSNVKTQISKPHVKSKNLERFKDLRYGFNILHLSSNIITISLIILIIMPGIAYLNIYRTPDVRFTTSDWVYKNIPSGSKILSETANVVDLPISPPNTYLLTPNYNLNYISFNFYDLDISPELQAQLKDAINSADYIFVPSRRVFANHTCENFQFSIFNFQSIFKSKCLNLKQKYPLLNDYYEKLFFGTLGFELVAEFDSYPKICLLRDTCYVLRDESAEETWSVFDHPVIRIYKKIPSSKSQAPNKSQISNNKFQNYQTTTYPISPNTYHLLIADTPEKWEKGLMDVRSKEELNGADGMIFIFPNKQALTFWNKNTYVDLDLYWLNDEEVVGKDYLQSITKTGNVTTINSPREINRVIEVIK